MADSRARRLATRQLARLEIEAEETAARLRARRMEARGARCGSRENGVDRARHLTMGRVHPLPTEVERRLEGGDEIPAD